MIVREFASVKMALGPKRTREDMRPKMPYPTTRMGTVAIVRAALLRAREYMEGRLDPERLDGEETLMLKILSELLKGKVPAHIHTSNMPDEIFSVIRIVDEFKIRATMDHGFGSELVAERVAESKIPVIYGPMMMARKSAGLKYVSDRTPGILTSKGVMTSIMTDHPVIPEKYLRLSAAVAVKNGMEPTEALKAITINPAQAIGISEKLGSIELGKDADLVVMSDKPLKVRSVVEMVLVNGEVVYQKQ
jgi:imidazolonepropionase-like amidohydrolase